MILIKKVHHHQIQGRYEYKKTKPRDDTLRLAFQKSLLLNLDKNVKILWYLYNTQITNNRIELQIVIQ